MNRKESYMSRLWNWRRKAAGGLPSTETNLDNSHSSQPAKQEVTQSSNTYHQSCRTLTYDRFVEILITGNLRWLAISGNPSEKELASAWQIISAEYSELVKTEKSEDIFKVWHKIIYTQFKINFLEVSLGILKDRYDLDIAAAVAQWGYDLVMPLEDRGNYLKQIYGIEMEAKLLIVLLNQYHNEYKLLNNEDGKAEVIRTIKDYEKDLAILSRFQGYRIKMEEITVLAYCSIVNNYIDHCNQQKRLSQKNGRDSVR